MAIFINLSLSIRLRRLSNAVRGISETPASSANIAGRQTGVKTFLLPRYHFIIWTIIKIFYKKHSTRKCLFSDRKCFSKNPSVTATYLEIV